MFSFSNGGPGGCDLKMLHICLTMIQFRIGYIYVKKTNWKWIVIQHPKLCLNLLFLLPIFNCKILKKTNPKITAFLCVFILFMFEYDLAKYISCLSELKDFFCQVIFNNFAVGWIPRSPWHLSIHSLAAGFALRVNKGGNLINMEAHLKMGLFCFFTYICIQWILFIYEYVHYCICISTGMWFVVQLGKLYLCMPKKIWQLNMNIEQSFVWLIGKQYFSVRGVIWIMYCKAFSSCVGYNTFCSIGSCIEKLT